MIVVDTSALMAVVLDEPAAAACSRTLENEVEVLISAGTLVEAVIVSARRRVGEVMMRLVGASGFEVVPVTRRTALEVGAAYDKWGRGNHSAGLNMGDCFAYALARENNCPLLFVGNDFSRTDITSAL